MRGNIMILVKLIGFPNSGKRAVLVKY